MAEITDSLGRTWDPDKHPRDRKGRFIRTFHKVRLFNVGGARPWGVGNVSSIDGADKIGVDVTALARGNPESAEHKVGEHYIAKASNLESVNEKASLAKTTSGAPDPDTLHALDFDNPNSQYERLSVSLANSRRKGGNPDEFVQALEQAGADPDIDPNAPDGLPALQPFLDEYNKANPLPNGYEEVLPQTKDREFKSSENRPRKGLSISASRDTDYFTSDDDGENWDPDDATDFEELLGGEDEEKASLDTADETPTPGSTEDDFLAELESIYEDDESVLEDGDTQELHNKYTVSRDGNKVSVAAPDGEVVATLPANTDQEHLEAAASKIFDHYDENHNNPDAPETNAPEEPKADLAPEADAPEEPNAEADTELTSEELDKLEILRDRAADTERDLFSVKPDEMDSLSIQKLADEGYITITEPGPNGNRTGRIQPKGHDALNNSGRDEIAPAPETPAEPQSVQERLDALSPEAKDFLVGDDFVENGSVHEDQIPGPVTGDLLDAEFIEKDSNDTYRLTDDGQTAMETELAKDFNPDEDGLADAPTPDSEEADNHEAAPAQELTPEQEDILTSLDDKVAETFDSPEPVSDELEQLENDGYVEINRNYVAEDHYEGYSATLTPKGAEKKKEIEDRNAPGEATTPEDGGSNEPDGGTGPIDAAQKSYDEAKTPEERQKAATESIDRIYSLVFEPLLDDNGRPVLDEDRNPVRVATGDTRVETKEEYIQRYRDTNFETSTAKWVSDENEFPEIGAWLLEPDTNPKDVRLNKFLVDEQGQFRYHERGIHKGQKIHKGDLVAFKFKSSSKDRQGIWVGRVKRFMGDPYKGGKINIEYTDANGRTKRAEIDYDNIYSPDGISDTPGRFTNPEIKAPAGLAPREELAHFMDSWFGSDNQRRFSRLDGNEKFVLSDGYYLKARQGGEPPYLALHAPDGRVVANDIEVPGFQYGTVATSPDSPGANPTHRFDNADGLLTGIEDLISDDKTNPPAPENISVEPGAPIETVPLNQSIQDFADTWNNTGSISGTQFGTDSGTAEVEFFELDDGTRVVVKEPENNWTGSGLESEIGGGEVLRVLGFNYSVVEGPDGRMIANYVEGAKGSDYLGRVFGGDADKIRAIKGSFRLAVFDFITANTDRHNYNWIYADGTVYPIDQELTLGNSRNFHSPDPSSTLEREVGDSSNTFLDAWFKPDRNGRLSAELDWEKNLADMQAVEIALKNAQFNHLPADQVSVILNRLDFLIDAVKKDMVTARAKKGKGN